MLLGNASAQTAADIVPKLSDTKLEVIPGKPAPRPERPLELSPFVVSGDKRPWRYSTLPGFEILTRAGNDMTQWLLTCYARNWQAENEVIPREWLRKSPIPYTIIIDDTDPGSSGLALAWPVLTKAKNYDEFGINLAQYKQQRKNYEGKVIPLRGWIHAADEDTTVLGANLHGDPFMLRAPSWLDRLDRCAPRLPRWLVAGLVGPQGLFENRTDIAMAVSYSSDPGLMPAAAIFRGIRWISTAESLRLEAEFWHHLGSVKFPFIPLREFFSESPPPPEQKALWESEAGLIVRWGLLDRGQVIPERRAKFVKFVERQRSEPVTEQMLIECFGRGYADLEKELKSYLKRMLGAELVFKMDDMISHLQPTKFSPATPEQVGRIIGDWQRMQGESLQGSEPAKAKALLDAADRTLSRAWLRNPDWLPPPGSLAAGKAELASILSASEISAGGHPDPDFLAVCGLYEFDVGESKLARDVLEIATALRTTRPKAYFVLAELRFQEAVAKPEGKASALSVAQTAFVLRPLIAQLPHATNARPWRLMIDTLARCESTPSAANLDMIIKGAAQYPRDAALQLATARLCLKSGERARALEVINKAFPLVVDENARDDFREMSESIRK